jgi:PAS domain S-box-containing protein
MNSLTTTAARDERPSALPLSLGHSEGVFQSLFERSADAIWLYDPQSRYLTDCNQAALALMGATSKDGLVPARPEDISPAMQLDGLSTTQKTIEVTAIVERNKGHHFEWLVRRLDGSEVPVEVTSTAVVMGGKEMHVVISRDISERKKAERELRELTQALERRVAERTAELAKSEERFRALVEHASEAIVVYSADTGRFLFGNQHACDLYGVPMSKLAELTPMDVSPEFQPGGRRTSDLAREKTAEVMDGGISVFEWVHRQPNGKLIPTEVRLLRLPAEGQKLIRASIIDNTERQRAERALRESEAKFRALFEGSSQGVVLHDGEQLLEANPAAVRILRRQSELQVVGHHPADFAPVLQPNGESSRDIAGRHIEECMGNGSSRFEWMAAGPDGEDIPLEVALTRIEWSGRQVIQAFITDITERKHAEQALRQVNTDLHREIEQRTRAEESLKESVRMSTLNAEVALALNASVELQPMLQRCSELIVQHLGVAFARVWTLKEETQTLELQSSAGCYTHVNGEHSRVKVGQYKIGWIAKEKKPLLTNKVQTDPRVSDQAWAAREGIVAFAGYPLLIEDRVLGVLAMFSRRPLGEDVLKTLGSVADSVALGIERKRAQTALAESEQRFSVAFQASPVFIGILRLSDGAYVLVNDALVNWVGYAREEVIGRTSAEIAMWDNAEERAAALQDLRTIGSFRQREVRWRNRRGERLTILLSAETIKLNNTPHILSFGQDITQRKRAEVDLLKTLEREKELSQLKSNFVSMVSHEFRTPLGIIQSSAELLRDFHARMQPEERQEQLASVTRNTRRMTGMMEDILVLSRLDAGKLDCRPAPIDLKTFCRRVVDEVLSATSRRCPIELSLPPVLAAAGADERLLGHIFTNLLSNAVKYSEGGATVYFSVEQNGESAVCAVRDRGIGISEADQQELFQAFHRGGNVGSRPGTGLGLLLVRRCADLHGGMIKVQSKLGEGTTVTVTLPLFNHEKNTGN